VYAKNKRSLLALAYAATEHSQARSAGIAGSHAHVEGCFEGSGISETSKLSQCGGVN